MFLIPKRKIELFLQITCLLMICDITNTRLGYIISYIDDINNIFVHADKIKQTSTFSVSYKNKVINVSENIHTNARQFQATL